MTHTILIGKGRRITLDELSSLSCGNAKLEMQLPTDDAPAESNNVDDSLVEGLNKLSLNSNPGTDGKELLSKGATAASLALLSLTLSQGRVVRGECSTQLASKLVDLVNVIVGNGNSDDMKNVQLPVDSAAYVASVNSLVGSELQGVLEDKSYVGRCISLGRVALMLAKGAFYLIFCFCY